MNCKFSTKNSNPFADFCISETSIKSRQLEDKAKHVLYLSKDFIPSDNDVIIGRGKKCSNHVGNQELRRIINKNIRKYATATSKADKSNIISSIVAHIRARGCFAKEDSAKPGTWFDIGDLLAREKIAQMFRDALHENYKSSTQYKNKKRSEKNKLKATMASRVEAWKISQLVQVINGDIGFHASNSKTNFDLVARNKAILKALESSWPSSSLQPQQQYPPVLSSSLSYHNRLRELPCYYQQQQQQQHYHNQEKDDHNDNDQQSTRDLITCLSTYLPVQCFEDDNPYEPNPIITEPSHGLVKREHFES